MNGMIPAMGYVIIGLGNPGGEYAKTRHNAGRVAVEALAKQEGFPEFALKKTAQALVSEGAIGGEKVTLVLPEVSMNLSGKSAPAFIKSKPAAKKLIVIRDELDLPLGTIKLTVPGRGSGGHKGVESIMRTLKTKDFVQIKIGISAETAKGKLKKPAAGEKVIKHVIGKFKPDEEKALKDVLARVATVCELFVTDGIEAAAMKANTR
ncbi:MAG: Aminoacyl-tRNA hydrolase, peptidyl-tRNA hydrolase, family [Parcubacteria group bacterium]|nr:Aminoacyl-tRNA hydrolase, peptidyl-tRNA hydrolase, family [Parcubacteria group bacterium]